MKSSTYFHVKAKILAGFQTCINVPLNLGFVVDSDMKIDTHLYITVAIHKTVHKFFPWNCFPSLKSGAFKYQSGIRWHLSTVMN